MKSTNGNHLIRAFVLVVLLVLSTANSAKAISFEEVKNFADTYRVPAYLFQASNGDFYGAGGGLDEVGTHVFRMYRSAPENPFQLEWKTIPGATGFMQASNGTIYVTSLWSDENPDGSIYKIQGGVATVFASFHRATTGAYPRAPLVEGADGNFYGTTVEGGDHGTIFKLTPSGTLTTLHLFDGTNGSMPESGLIRASDDCFYGTTPWGGNTAEGWGTGMGTVFKITTNGTFTVVHKFNGTDGAAPKGGIIQGSDGNFYGTTWNGYGQIFKMTPAGVVTTLHVFNGWDGSDPDTRLVEGTNGAFYGTTRRGGFGMGTLFKVTTSGSFTVLRNFDGEEWTMTSPSTPVLANDGYFYGTVPDATINSQRVDGYIYRFVDDANSDVPSFALQPESVTQNYNTTAQLSSFAVGLQPLSYQWRFNGTNLTNGGNVAGANSPFLTLNNLTADGTGNYSVVVTNSAGSVTSTVAVVTVNDPVILAQPSSRTNLVGSTATFTVTANGSGTLAYQWKQNGTNLLNGGRVSGALSSSLTITNVTLADVGSYTVVVSHSKGTVESSAAALTVTDLVIITEPVSRTIMWGSTGQISVVAGGTGPFTYQWRRYGTNLVDGGRISGTTSSVLTFTEAMNPDSGAYSVVVSDAFASVTSTNAQVSIDSIPTVTSQPVSVTTNAGSTVTFHASMSGSHLLVYRWARGTITTNGHSVFMLNNGGNISGADTTTLTISNVTSADATNYILFAATNASQILLAPSVPGSARSAQATLTVLDTPIVVSQPASRTLLVGTDTTLNVTATGGGPISYQWVKDGTPIIGATNTSLELANVQLSDSGDYSVILTGAQGSTTSQFAHVTVLYPKAIYSGLFYETNGAGVRHESSGSFYATFNGTNFTAKIILEGLATAFSGRLGVGGNTTRPIIRTNFNRQNLSITFAVDSANDQIRGAITSPDWSAEVLADRYPYTTNYLATAYQGNYTLVIPGFTNGTAGPVGYSCAAISVTSLGRLKLGTATLADGQAFQTSTTLSGNGTWPFYSPVYPLVVTNGLKKWKEYRGSVLGWMTITNNEPIGNVSWIKTGWTNALYSGGFTNESEAFGSSYSFVKGVRVLSMTNGSLTFSGGNLASPFTANVLLTTNNTLTAVLPQTNRASSTLTAKTGIFRGTFRHPENTNVVTRFAGAVLQNENAGAGYFFSTNHNGTVILQPAP